MNDAITINKLTKKFPRTSGYRDLLPFRERKWITAVNELSFEVKEGELFGLLGPNGAGKTTLIKLLCCLVLPNSGNASIFGHDILRQEQVVKNLVGLVSAEERSFFWRLTGRENLKFFASLYRLSGQKANKRIDELLDFVDLADEGDIRFQNYSTGMRQKLAIARGLLSEPRIIFVDEPTRSLDPISAQNVRSFLKEKVAGEGKTIILATHNLNEAEQLCDRLAIMHHGRLISIGSVHELRSIFQTYDGCEFQVKNFNNDILYHLQNIEGVHECNITGQQDSLFKLEFKITNRLSVLPKVMHTLVNGGVEICNCQVNELPIDEIFAQAIEGSDFEGEK
ncbi:ABC transporter ATP-binding protein [Chloroflexota bacterium]